MEAQRRHKDFLQKKELYNYVGRIVTDEGDFQVQDRNDFTVSRHNTLGEASVALGRLAKGIEKVDE